MEDEQTCGRGLAANSVLPATVGALIDSLAAVLETHVAALDLTDEHAVLERDVYLGLATAQRRISVELEQVATNMTAARDLPMARHDMAVMTSSAPREAFESYVAAENALWGLLGRSLERDKAMLAAMSVGGHASG